MNRYVPKRRFKGYDVPWEESKLEEKVQFYSGLTYKPMDLRKEGTLVLRSSNIKDSKLVLSDNVFVNSQVVNVSNVKCNDIVMVVRNGSRELIGKHTLLRENLQDTVIGAFMTGIRAENYEFINVLFDTDLFKNLVQINMGATINQITGYMFSNMKFNFPSDEEQKLIGAFFKNLDKQIDKQGKKVEKLKNLKNAYLSEMFPAEGELLPKRKFKGFTEPWEERKLGEEMDVRDGTHDSPKYVSHGYPLITSKNVGNGKIDFQEIQYISEDDYNIINKRSKVEKGDILMGMIGTIGNMAIVKETPEYAIKNVALIKKTKGISVDYIYNLLNSRFIISQIEKKLDGGTQRFLALNKIRELVILLPSLSEQKLIGSFFKKLDDKINLEQKKLEKLKQLKQAYLEEMFV